MGLYRQDTIDDELDELEATYATIRRSGMLRLEVLRCVVQMARSQLLVAIAQRRASRTWANRADRLGKEMMKQDSALLRTYGGLARAGVAAYLGKNARAVEILRETEELARTSGQKLVAAVARVRLGGLVTGDEGASLLHDGRSYLIGQGVEDIPGVLRMMAGGFQDE